MDYVHSQGESQGRKSFTTIDDVIYLSQELFTRLTEIGKYKHPLAVRKGVKVMPDNKESETVRAGAITYFFDIKETRDSKPFLIITESRFKGEGEDHERKSIIVFQEHINEFAESVSKMKNILG